MFRLVLALVAVILWSGSARAQPAETLEDFLKSTPSTPSHHGGPSCGFSGDVNSVPQNSSCGNEDHTHLNDPVAEGDTLRLQLLEDARVEWGQNFFPGMVTVYHKDVTCDGQADYVASYANLDNPDGPFFNILIVTEHEGEPRTDSLSLPFTGATEQYGLCQRDGITYADIKFDEWPQEEIDEILEGANVCSTAVEAVDTICDSPRFFWSNEAAVGEPRWVFHRN